VPGADPGIESRALRSVPWSLLAYASARVISLAGTIALARLIAPEDLGVFFIATVVLAVGNLLGDTGLGVTLVVRKELDDRTVGIVLVSMIGASLVAAGLIVALAGPLAGVFDAPQLADVLRVLAGTVVFTTGGYFFLSLLQREMRFERRFVAQFLQAVTYVAVAVPIAVAEHSVWAPVYGHIAGSLVALIALSWLAPTRVRPAFALRPALRIYREALAFVSQAFTAFVGYNTHLLAVAGFIGSRPMALYTMSFRLSELPAMGLAGPIAQATFPAYAQLRDDPERRRGPLLTSLRFVALVALPAMTALGVLAGPFVAGVLGPNWEGMESILPILAGWGAVASVSAMLSWYINAIGGAGWLARLYLRFLLVAPLVCVTAAVTDSPEAVAAVLLTDISIESLLILRYVHRRLGVTYVDAWRAIRPPVVGAIVLAAVALGVSAALESADASELTRFLGGAVAGLAAYALTVMRVEPELLRHGRSLFRRGVRGAA
jgi:O-antigen/teichoic acid export membrane protein